MTKRLTKKFEISKVLKFAASGVFALLYASSASAQTLNLGLDAADFGLPDMDIRVLIGNLVRAGLGLVGVIMIINIMEAGFKIMTHGGNEEKKIEAYNALKSSVIGLIIILMSGSMAKFVIDAIANATGNSSPLS